MFRTTFEKLRNRFGMTKIIAVSGVSIFLTVSFVATGISNAVQAAKVNEAISSAENLLKQGDWLGARQVVEKLDAELPTSVPQKSIETLTSRINALEDSQEAFAKAESLKEERKYLASVIQFSNVIVADISNYEVAQLEIKAIEPLAIDQALQQSKILSKSKKYSEAISAVNVAIEVLGDRPQLIKARTTYVSAQVAENQRIRSSALSKLRKTKDSFESTTWYKDYSSPIYSNANAFYLTFGASGSMTNSLWLRVTYFDDDWLFVNQARVNVDGEIYSLSCSNWERDNNSEIWEWCDISFPDRAMIEAIIKSKKAVIRFDGDKYYDTRTISSSQKQALRNVLRAYDAF